MTVKYTWFKDVLLSKNFWLGTSNTDTLRPDLSVTVVIPAWNEEACIADTIRSVQAQTYPTKIIVVDDCSTDNTGQIARDLGVKVLVPDDNTGTKSQALNVAIPHTDTDIFVCVDADTQLEPDSIWNLLKSFNDPNVAVASGYVLSRNSGNLWERGRGAEYLTSQSVVKAAQQNLNIVMVAAGCFMGVRTHLLAEAGGYKDRSMAEDMDLTWEFIERGYRIDFNQQAVCRVIDPHDWYTFRKQVGRWYHGFVQCIKVRNFNLFSKNPKLGIIAYGYGAMSALGPVLMIAGIPLVVSQLGLALFLFMTVFYFGILWVVAAVQAVRLGESIWVLTKSMPHMVATMFLTYGIFFTVLVKELVLKKSLTTWVKGH